MSGGISYWKIYKMEAFLKIRKAELLANGFPGNHSAIKFEYRFSEQFERSCSCSEFERYLI